MLIDFFYKPSRLNQFSSVQFSCTSYNYLKTRQPGYFHFNGTWNTTRAVGKTYAVIERERVSTVHLSRAIVQEVSIGKWATNQRNVNTILVKLVNKGTKRSIIFLAAFNTGD